MRGLLALGIAMAAVAGCSDGAKPACPYPGPPPCPGGGSYVLEGDGSDHIFKVCRLDGELHGPFWSRTDDGCAIKCGVYNNGEHCGPEMIFMPSDDSCCGNGCGYEFHRQIGHEACPF